MTNSDPRTKYPIPPFPETEFQDQPGLTALVHPTPDHGENSYRGTGQLKGCKALITGGDSGIGRAVAIAFAREGADVAISYLPAESADAHEVQKLVTDAGVKCVLLPGDLREEATCAKVVAQTVEELGGLDTLVLNAATQFSRNEDVDIPLAEILKVFETNLISPLLLMREAAPHLQPGSTVTVTASIQAYNPSPDLLDYAMSKSALVAFTQAQATEQAKRGIRVNAVAPGPIWTPLISGTDWGDKIQNFGADSPFGRPGQPAEVAPAYVFLASEAASYVSGAVLPVTGGKHL